MEAGGRSGGREDELSEREREAKLPINHDDGKSENHLLLLFFQHYSDLLGGGCLIYPKMEILRWSLG